MIFERHIRKLFPSILQSELEVLNPANYVAPPSGFPVVRNDYYQVPSVFDARVMTPSEALVFFLGGFSSNPERPFTGDGGPFVITQAGSQTVLQYNPSRKNSFYEFDASRLSITLGTIAGVALTISNDESTWNMGDAQSSGSVINDILPVYYSKYSRKGNAAYVYFDSRTYRGLKGGIDYFAEMRSSDPTRSFAADCARPYLSDQLDTTPGSGGVKYMADTSFQLLGPVLTQNTARNTNHCPPQPAYPFYFDFRAGNRSTHRSVLRIDT